MKKIVLVVILIVAVSLGVILMRRSQDETGKTPAPKTPASVTQTVTNEGRVISPVDRRQMALDTNRAPTRTGDLQIPSRAERSKMSTAEKLQLFEKLGCLPPDSDWSEFTIGEKTSWWGKRPDPKTFWTNRVVWLDETARGASWRHGRSYPPMPYDDPSVADRNDTDRTGNGFDIQGGPSFQTVSSQRESAFWDKFVKTHPHPPDAISRFQRDHAENWLSDKNILEHDPAYAARLQMKPERLGRTLTAAQDDAKGLGYPPECLAPDAYRWSHIMQKRQEYEAIRTDGQVVDNVTTSNFFRRVYVDRKYITEPLSPDDIKAANAWKVAYLTRLRKEKTDESYINAYMQAWSLSSNDVFGVTP